MIVLAYILSGLSLLMSVLFLIHLRNPFGWIVLFPKLTAEGLSPYWAVMGAAGAVIGGDIKLSGPFQWGLLVPA